MSTSIVVLVVALALIVEVGLPGQLANAEYSTERNVEFSDTRDGGVDLYVQYLGFGREERKFWIRRKEFELVLYETGVLEKARIIETFPDSVIIGHESKLKMLGEGDGTIVFSVEEKFDTLHVRVRQSDGEYVLTEI
jgi:hypothetical protein